MREDLADELLLICGCFLTRCVAQGKFGHEFLEFEFRPDGKMRYANNSNYKNDTMIRKEVFVNEGIIEAVKKIVKDSDIMKEDDRNWPLPDKVGRQELEVRNCGTLCAFKCECLQEFGLLCGLLFEGLGRSGVLYAFCV